MAEHEQHLAPGEPDAQEGTTEGYDPLPDPDPNISDEELRAWWTRAVRSLYPDWPEDRVSNAINIAWQDEMTRFTAKLTMVFDRRVVEDSPELGVETLLELVRKPKGS